MLKLGKYFGLDQESGRDVLIKSPIPVGDKEFEEEYDALAKKLGVQCRAGSTLKRFLGDQQIGVYSLPDVEKYMDGKGKWCWYPLRSGDRCADEGKVWRITRETVHSHPDNYGYQDDHQYDKPVPYSVLLTVKTIADYFGSDVLFLVAAPCQHPDPFLAVMQRSNWGKLFVIERWDEPGFRSTSGG